MVIFNVIGNRKELSAFAYIRQIQATKHDPQLLLFSLLMLPYYAPQSLNLRYKSAKAFCMCIRVFSSQTCTVQIHKTQYRNQANEIRTHTHLLQDVHRSSQLLDVMWGPCIGKETALRQLSTRLIVAKLIARAHVIRNNMLFCSYTIARKAQA